MKMTERNLLALRGEILAFAASRFRTFGLSRCDLHDVVDDAYLKARGRLSKHSPRKNPRALIRAIAWSAVMNELKRRGTIAALHERFDLRIDAPRPNAAETGDDGDEDDGDTLDILNDGGRAAAEIRSFDEPPEPEWVYAVRIVRARLCGEERKIANLLVKGLSPRETARRTGLSTPRFWGKMKNLQVRFAQCYQAYRAWCAENR